MNFVRKFFWSLSSKKIDKIFCPSKDLLQQLSENKIFPLSKLVFLADPILSAKDLIL